jgi:aminoglycoside phosphotransferase
MSAPSRRRPTNRDAWSVLEGVISTPAIDVEVPAIVLEIAGGRSVQPIWVNQLGGLTCEVGEQANRWFVKWTPPGAGAAASEEAARMSWLASFSRVPEVLDVVDDPHSDATVLVSTALPGETAVADKWKANPATTVAAIGHGLRYLHDHAPVDRCPFSWSTGDRVEQARRRVAAATTQPSDWHPVHQELTVEEAMSILHSPPPLDTAVVCHGDACAPNTIIDHGLWTGHVDLGAAGIADRWADLAVATWSTEWNYGLGWDRPLLDAYGVEPDPERTVYYRLLWDLAS